MFSSRAQAQEAQKREISDMQWLIQDIEQNGVTSTQQQADQRQVPDFCGETLRECYAAPTNSCDDKLLGSGVDVKNANSLTSYR